ncbi:MAG: HDOD domain-containing protein [Thermodesulfobacteriota bacterium]
MTAEKKGKELDLEQQIEFLKKISFFHGFDDHELRQFLQVTKWLRVPANTMIIKENTTERAFYILVRGEVRVEKRQQGGGPVLLTTLASGDCFGEMALVTEIKRTADVVAAKDSFLLRVEPEIVNTSNVFLQLKFYKRFCESLVARLDQANRKVAGQSGEEAAPSLLQATLVEQPQPEPETPPSPPQPVVAPPPRPRLKPRLDEESIPPLPNRDDRLTASKLYALVHPENPLPVNPAVAEELSAMLRRGTESDNTRRFADLISLDPVLSCRVIQTANSPFFRRATMVGSVPHAMVVIGVKQVQEVVLGTIRAAKDLAAFGGYASVAQGFWRHAVVVGRIAETLRETIRVSLSADIYLCGLFHDLGMLLLHSFAPTFYPNTLRPLPEIQEVAKAEKEFIGVDHGQAGVWLAEGIGLPQPYPEVMKFHHVPEKAHTYPIPVALVSLANQFASMRGVCLGQPSVEREEVLRSFAWVLLQENHRPFLDVSILPFFESFSEELDRTWSTITADIPL